VGQGLKSWSVRIFNDQIKYGLVAFEQRGGPDGKTIYDEINRIEKELSLAEWSAIEQALEIADYWSLVSDDQSAMNSSGGSRLLFEGKKAGQYHPVHRVSPLELATLADVTRLMVKYAGLILTEDHAKAFTRS
jgi:hypothetical protein